MLLRTVVLQLCICLLLLLTALPSLDGKCVTRQVPTETPTESPTETPTETPTESPTFAPTLLPGESHSPTTLQPTESPTTSAPTDGPTFAPSLLPGETYAPSTLGPTTAPSQFPTFRPTRKPTTIIPTREPSNVPSFEPTDAPTTELPSALPTETPTDVPTTIIPSARPTIEPTLLPGTTAVPSTKMPSATPSIRPTARPTVSPSMIPTRTPSQEPSFRPTAEPTEAPTTNEPTFRPTRIPTVLPTTANPSRAPTFRPTLLPGTTDAPSTQAPSAVPTTTSPSSVPTRRPTSAPSTTRPTATPTTRMPTAKPTTMPTTEPTEAPTEAPTVAPSFQPTQMPSTAMPTAPLNMQLTMQFTQNLQLADVDSFQTTAAAQDVFRAAVAESVTYLTIDSVAINTITTVVRRRVLRNSDYSVLQSGQVSIQYAISVFIESLGYRDVDTALADIQAQLQAAIESGFFDTLLLNFADEAGVLAILNGALSSDLVLVSYSVYEKQQSDDEIYLSWPLYAKILLPVAGFAVLVLLICVCICVHDWNLQRKYTNAHSEGFMTSSGTTSSPKKGTAGSTFSFQSQLVSLLLGKDNISDTGSEGFYEAQSEGQGQPSSPANNAVISERSVEIVLTEDGGAGTPIGSNAPESLQTTIGTDGLVTTSNPVAGTPSKPSIKTSGSNPSSPAPVLPPAPTVLPNFVPDHPAAQSSHDAMSPLMARSKPQLPSVPSVGNNKNKKTQRTSLLGLMNFSSPATQRKEKFKGEKRNSKTSQATAASNELAMVPIAPQPAAVSTPVPEVLGADQSQLPPPVQEVAAAPQTPVAVEEAHTDTSTGLASMSPFNILGAFFGLHSEPATVEHTEEAVNNEALPEAPTEGQVASPAAPSTLLPPPPPSPTIVNNNPILQPANSQPTAAAPATVPAPASVAASSPASPVPPATSPVAAHP